MHRKLDFPNRQVLETSLTGGIQIEFPITIPSLFLFISVSPAGLT